MVALWPACALLPIVTFHCCWRPADEQYICLDSPFVHEPKMNSQLLSVACLCQLHAHLLVLPLVPWHAGMWARALTQPEGLCLSV
jgi:hypothetical protein